MGNTQAFNGKNYTIELVENQFVLVHPIGEDETFDSFEELVDSHPVCEEARSHFFDKMSLSCEHRHSHRDQHQK